MKKLFSNKELFKESIQSLGYFMLLASMARMLAPYVKNETITIKYVFSLSIMCAMLFISTYVVIYTLIPITQLYFPNFSYPIVRDIDSKTGNWRGILSLSFWFFCITTTVVIVFAIVLIKAAIKIGIS